MSGAPKSFFTVFPRLSKSKSPPCRKQRDKDGAPTLILTSYPHHDSHLFSLPRRPLRLNFHHAFNA